MHGHADTGVPLERFHHWQIGLTERGFEDVWEVSHRLVVVDRQREDETVGHAARSWRRTGRDSAHRGGRTAASIPALTPAPQGTVPTRPLPASRRAAPPRVARVPGSASP